ncbi:MAG: TlpA family protein disulfide reductase [Chloroflexi bacterium]|nr:TlpA family protein disulfide reductase [Chloroflexota bacterium]
MSKMSRSASSLRLQATLLIGMGLIAIGVMSLLLLKDSPPAAVEPSIVPVRVDFAAPHLALKDLNGKAVSLSDYAGDVVLVNLWATWCPPCREEMPVLQAFYEKRRSQGFVLIGVNQEETPEIVHDFASAYNLTFPIWLDENYLAQRAFNTFSLPSSFVIDRAGRVRLMWVGGVSEKFLEKYIMEFFKE